MHGGRWRIFLLITSGGDFMTPLVIATFHGYRSSMPTCLAMSVILLG
ncbi:hypothetical protein A2U01_0070522, partial [Trifolium medium]|nr:hypothetical protein [Trifolium medium]